VFYTRSGAYNYQWLIEFLLDLVRLQAAISSVADCPVPVVAAVHGCCIGIGAGADLVTAFDARVCPAGAVLPVRETKMAIAADLGTRPTCRRCSPMGHVVQLVYTGREVPARRAAGIRLVNRV
jgi:enoyl-CoA hydratase